MNTRAGLRHASLVGIVTSALFALGSGCSGFDENPAIGRDRSEGAEGDRCRATGTGCNDGLVCVSEVCVNADGGSSSGDSGGDGSSCSSTAPTGTSCSAGSCYCASSTKCFASSVADQCCDGPVTCGTSDAGNPDAPQCGFKHPLLDAGARYCGPGDCYCSNPDNCYPFAIAAQCCAAPSVTCY